MLQSCKIYRTLIFPSIILALSVTLVNGGLLENLFGIKFHFQASPPSHFLSKPPPNFAAHRSPPSNFVAHRPPPSNFVSNPPSYFEPKPASTIVVTNPVYSELPIDSKHTSINFYFEENLWGKPKKVLLRKNKKCMNVPANYFHEKPKSIWASDCIMVYKKDFCWGHGVRVAGSVHELRTVGLYKGISSFKPCESNIHITFKKG